MADIAPAVPIPPQPEFVEHVQLELLAARMRAYAILGVRPPRAAAMGYGSWIMERSVAIPPKRGYCHGLNKGGREHGLLLRCSNRAAPGSTYCRLHARLT